MPCLADLPRPGALFLLAGVGLSGRNLLGRVGGCNVCRRLVSHPSLTDDNCHETRYALIVTSSVFALYLSLNMP